MSNANDLPHDTYQVEWPIMNRDITLQDLLYETQSRLAADLRKHNRAAAETARYELYMPAGRLVWRVRATVLLEDA